MLESPFLPASVDSSLIKEQSSQFKTGIDLKQLPCCCMSFLLEMCCRVRPTGNMPKVKGRFLKEPINIKDDREIVQCDELEFPFKWNREEGYVLIRIHEGQICVGWVDGINHEMNVEFRGTDPGKLAKEIIRRDFLSPSMIAFISAEVVRARNCLDNDVEYVQG
jgi:hypothetical protein